MPLSEDDELHGQRMKSYSKYEAAIFPRMTPCKVSQAMAGRDAHR